LPAVCGFKDLVMIEILPQILSDTAARHGGRAALVMDSRTITYRELETASNQFARSLKRQGVGRGDRVGLWLPKSIETIVAVYGIMKAGAAYVPIDPGAPKARMGYIARDCSVAGLVTVTERTGAVANACAGVTPMKAIWYADARRSEVPTLGSVAGVSWQALNDESADSISFTAQTDDLAYILYTSGSTGEPKGVMLSHRNALSFVNWAGDTFGISVEDRLANHAPFHFDLSVFDLYVGARAGATVFPVSPRIASFPAATAKQWSEQKLTVWYATPSTLVLMLTRGGLASLDLSALRLLLFAGEVFPNKYLRSLMQLAPQVRFANLYGPTETNVCTWYEVSSPPEGNTPIPIGQACSNCELYILDEECKPVAEGQAGELWVSGSTVMQGYWGRPERTSQSLKQIEMRPGLTVRAYNTGDLVRMRPDGDIEFLGRRDHQIKTRGYRVELGEIESVLHSHPAVEEAVVLALPDEAIGHRLAAVIVTRQKAEVSKAELQQYCADALPRYMVPGALEFSRVLPRTSSGKVDRQALAASLLNPRQTISSEELWQQP
jgi:amino acid adenylation domain-containing protein